MNPRLFCREQSYHKALLLTYSFDPIFFEQVVLHDLWAGRSSDILVLGDKAQIQTATQAAAGQLWHLGKRYLLADADISGAFHPKLFLRLGPKDGLVMLGSGNVTSSGWGGNQELGTAWMVGPDHVDKGVWLHPFLDDVLGWCGSELARDAVRRIKDVPWLSLTPAASSASAPVLHSRQGRALATDLAQRWAGRQFDEVRFSPAQRMRPARSYDGRTPRSVSSGPPLHSRHRRRVSCQTSWRTFRSTCASFLRRQARCCTPSCIGSWAQGVLPLSWARPTVLQPPGSCLRTRGATSSRSSSTTGGPPRISRRR